MPTLPETCLPKWDVAELPAPAPLSWRNWTRLLGPGIVMMGIQIGGGEWLFGPEVTARYGGGLLWIATVAIVLQVFYNLECGRYALYCGEPVFTGFMRTRPGPPFWAGLLLLLNLGALIPGLSTHAAAGLAAIVLDRPPAETDRSFIMGLSYLCLVLVVLPVLFGGKVYNTLQAIMTAKVLVVLGWCLVLGVLFVSLGSWLNVLGGFLQFGSLPVSDPVQGERVVNAFAAFAADGRWPVISLANVAVLGAFAGYAGGGGLSNSTYSNYVRDKGWGMGGQVGAIASAVGGKNVLLSHLGKVFEFSAESARRWRGWWRHILVDQLCIWAPGCFVGMALPALLSLEFAPHSELYSQTERFQWAQAAITADGMRHAPGFSPAVGKVLWLGMLLVGLMVLLPSQMSIVDDFSRRWTDVIWSASRRARERLATHQVKYIYYTILGCYVLWSVVALHLFSTYGSPKLMILVIANLGNVALGVTAFHLLWVNLRLLPPPLRPRWYHALGVLCCGGFYLGVAGLVFYKIARDAAA